MTKDKELLEQVLHISDAVELTGRSAVTLRAVFADGKRFKIGVECRKCAKGDWLVTRKSLEREYGPFETK